MMRMSWLMIFVDVEGRLKVKEKYCINKGDITVKQVVSKYGL